MDNFWLEVILIFLLILANGFFAGSEIAIVSARRSRIKQLAEGGDPNAQRVHQLQTDPGRFLATVQIGITLVSTLASAVGGAAAIEVIKPLLQGIPISPIQRASELIAIGIVVVVISYLSLIIGELIPKSLALRYSEKIAFWVAKPIDWLSRITSPFVRMLTASTNILLLPFGRKSGTEGALFSEEELKFIVKEGREKGVFDQIEQELIHGIFEFTDITVKEVMVPRPKIQAIQIDTPPKDVLRFISEWGFTRYPVYKETLDDICGILYSKDLFERIEADKPILIGELFHPVYFIPETMKVSHLLKELQRRRIQMAIVLNEYGNVEGLVTMEDLIEEIVGEIEDEYDLEEKPVKKLEDGSYVIDASQSIRDLIGNYNLSLPESPEFETLAGFVLSQLQRMPKGGEIIQYGNYKFTIVDMEGRRIAKVKMEKIQKNRDPA